MAASFINWLSPMVFILIKWGGLVAASFYNTLPCFGWFSLIRARNHASFVLLDSLLYKEFFEKVS